MFLLILKNPITRLNSIIKNIDLKYIITDMNSSKLLKDLDEGTELIFLDNINLKKR